MTDFATDLRALISKHEDSGLHLSDILTALKQAVAETRRTLMPSKPDDAFNAERGLPPLTEADLRKLLQLESYEPMPPQRRD